MKTENCKMPINTSDNAAVVDVYKIVVDELKAASLISPSVDTSGYFDPVVKLEVSEINDLGEFFFSVYLLLLFYSFFLYLVIFFLLPFAGTSKSRFVPLKRPSEMSTSDFEKLPPEHNWSPDVKKGTASIFIDKDDPSVPLVHLAVGIVHAVREYGEYGKMIKRYEMACKVVNYSVTLNRVVVSSSKLGGQRLCLINGEMLQNWIQTLCDNFSCYVVERSFQGDGNAPLEIAEDGTDLIVPSHAMVLIAVRTSDQLYKYYLYNIKAQKQAGLHLTSDDNRAKEADRNKLMNNIYIK
jgi:hypothetical protein